MKIKRSVRLLRVALSAVTALLILNAPPVQARPAKRADMREFVDNAALIPKILPDDQVKMEEGSPDWFKGLVIVQFRVETATPEGTFQSATKVLGHYAEMGVNGLWINPIWERGSKGNGYGNQGPDRVEPLLTGTPDTDFSAVRTFVSEAHRRNIRVFFDFVVWGTAKDSPLVTQHPEFYTRNADGSFWQVWSGYGFDWNQPALREWYRKAAVDFILATGADGFRVDLAPDTSGYFFQTVRQDLYAKGRKVVIISELPNDRRDTFDTEQRSVLPYPYLFNHNIVDAVKSGDGIGTGLGHGQYRYYTANLVDHDDGSPVAQGDRVRFAYGTLFAPFLPMWWIGEEWNNPQAVSNVLYFNSIDWAAGRNPSNLQFYTDIKRYLRIRRSYPQIFENFPSDARSANIGKVSSTINGKPNALQAYARFGLGVAILIVPNTVASPEPATVRVTLDCSTWELDPRSAHVITDLLSGQTIPLKQSGGQTFFQTHIEQNHLGLYRVVEEKRPHGTH